MCDAVEFKKKLVDLRKDIRARVGGVKNGRFLFHAKKAQDAYRAVVWSPHT